MIRFRRQLTAAVMAGSLLSLSACNNNSPSNVSADETNARNQAKLDVGPPLYTPGPPLQPLSSDPAPEPIVIPNAVVQSDIRVQVPAQIDGVIEIIGFEAPANTPDGPLHVYHPRDIRKQGPVYRRLRENDRVQKDQMIGRQDEQLIQLQIRASASQITQTKEAIKAAKEAMDAQQQVVDRYKNLSGVSDAEKFNNEALMARYRENMLQSMKELAKLEGELETANGQMLRTFIKSPITGRIVKMLKNPGEFAKAGDPIMEIQAIEKVRVEGKLDIGYAAMVRPGMQVIVEPARPIGPSQLVNYHRQEVTSIAVTAHPGRPMIVSGGLDSAALVWDPFQTQQSHRLPHPAGVGVRSVACTGDKAKGHLVVTGGDDGKVRLWDVTNPDKLPQFPLATFEETHNAAVVAAAFSPDGRYLATAAGRDVYIWDVAQRTRKYTLPADHRDAITTLKFTPQATLVTAARDRSVRIWKLGETGAVTQNVIDHRGGSVELLGVSSDGSRMMFDKDSSRLDVVSLADERSVGTLQSPGGGARFATLALFSPDDAFIVTAGGEADQKGELTLWEAPQTGGRAAERLRLMTPKGSVVTCAAFAGDAEKRFVAVGTQDGGVYFWTQAGLLAQRGKPMVGEVVSVLPADSRSVQVRVEMNNPSTNIEEMLQDRSLATIIINPEALKSNPPQADAGVRPATTLPGDATGIQPAGGLLPVAPAAQPPAPTAPVTSAPSIPMPPPSTPMTPGLPPVPIPTTGSDKK